MSGDPIDYVFDPHVVVAILSVLIALAIAVAIILFPEVGNPERRKDTRK